MGTYTPNYNLYMPSIGEQGWGELVSNNFEILDTVILNNLNNLQNQITTNLNNLQDQIDVINTNIGNGTRVLSISSPPSITITTSNFGNYASYDNNVYTAQCYGNITFSSIPQPSYSCRLMIITVNGNAIISGSIDTYPTTLQTETPPNSTSTNTYGKKIIFSNFSSCTLTYTANANNSQILINHTDYLNFINNTSNLEYTLSIPHAIAAGGRGAQNGTAGTATNTCNGGGGGAANYADGYKGGTGCIFGQYSGGNRSDGYGYGSGANNKYRCGLVIIVNGNLTITNSGTIIQNGGSGNTDNGIGGYGGGAGRGNNDERYVGGGGGAPVFIYYTGTYVNNGTIKTNGGGGSIGISGSYYGGSGGAGGIKVTKISI